jgi:PAS domain S-box-containing protein
MIRPFRNRKTLLAGCLAVVAAGCGVLALCGGGLENEELVPGRKLSAASCALSSFPLVLLSGLGLLRGRGRSSRDSTERKFQGLLDAAPDAIIMMDNNRRIVLVNRQMEMLSGYSHAELLGKSIEDLLVPEEAKIGCTSSRNDYRNSSTRQLDREGEPSVLSKDGKRVPVEIKFSALQTKEGPLTISIIRDVSERRMLERRRTARHAVRRILADATTFATAAPCSLHAMCESLDFDMAVLWLVDPESAVLRCAYLWRSPLAKGVSFEISCRVETFAPGVGLPGRIWTTAKPVALADIAQDEDLPRLAAAQVDGLHGSFGFPILSGQEVLGVVECYSREKQKSDENLLDTLTSIGGQLGRFLTHQRAEDALRESEARQRAMFEAALDAIITFDHTGKLVEFNPAAEKVFGYSRSEVLGKSMDMLVPVSLRGPCRQALADYVQTGDGPGLGERIESVALRQGGNEFPVEIAISRIDGDGPPLFTAYIRDLSQRKAIEQTLRQTEEQYRHAQKLEAVGRLSGGVAHDFNNLLTIITGYSQVLLAERTDDPVVFEAADEIRKATERAAGLTRQLLAFSRKQVLELKTLDLNNLVRDVEKMVRRGIGEDINLVMELADDLQRIKADRGQIEQVLMNLAVNARDAMPTGGKLTIATRNVEVSPGEAASYLGVERGAYVQLEVTDTGCGMDDAVKARIFEPFFTTKEEGKGTGLGLATVYGIVKQSGGSIHVETVVGQGTTFRIYLPRTEGPAPSLQQAAPVAEPRSGNETVLLVEDEDALRALASRVLKSKGYRVLEARHGAEALQLYGADIDSVDLTITDVVMPEMNGRELVHRLMQQQPSMKVLYMSGYNEEAILRNGALDPGTALLEKPFTPLALARKVSEVLSA